MTPTDERYFDGAYNQEGYDYWIDGTLGTTLEKPFQYIAQAFNRNGDITVRGYETYQRWSTLDNENPFFLPFNPYEIYENITVNIWL